MSSASRRWRTAAGLGAQWSDVERVDDGYRTRSRRDEVPRLADVDRSGRR